MIRSRMIKIRGTKWPEAAKSMAAILGTFIIVFITVGKIFQRGGQGGGEGPPCDVAIQFCCFDFFVVVLEAIFARARASSSVVG